MKKLAIILLLILLLPVLSWADTTIYGATGSADLNSPGPIGATTPSTGKFTGLTVAPTATGTLLDFLLETEWTTGTILNADFGSATVQSGNMFGIILDFNTNLAGVTDQDIGSFVTMTPALTQTTSNTTNYIGYSLPTAGALVQTTNAGSIYWTGFNLQMPNITQTTGTVKSYGLYINGGTVTSGTQYAIFVDSGNVRLDGSLGDTTNRTVKGWFTDIETTNMPTINGAAITTILQPLIPKGYVYLPAGSMTPITSAGLATVSQAPNMTDYLAFDGATDEYAAFTLSLEDWDLGTIKAKFVWYASAAMTNGHTVIWGLNCYAVSDGDTSDVAFDTGEVTVSDAYATGDETGPIQKTTAATAVITVQGTPAAGDVIYCRVMRNADTDTSTIDAWLVGVKLEYGKTSPTAW